MSIKNIISYITDNWIAITALILSVPSCILGIINYKNAIPKLKITTDAHANYLVGFMYYSEYRLAIAHVIIENISSADVTMSNISLLIDGNEYYATLESFPTRYSQDGLFFPLVDSENRGLELKTFSENILHNMRVESRGVVHGYLIFTDIKQIDKPLFAMLSVKTPTKIFKSDILFIPLPKCYKTTFTPLQE